MRFLDPVIHTGCAAAGVVIAGVPSFGVLNDAGSLVIMSAGYGALWSVVAMGAATYRRTLHSSFWRVWQQRAKVTLVLLPVIAVILMLQLAPVSLGLAAWCATAMSLGIGCTAGAAIERWLTPSRKQLDRAVLLGTEATIYECARRLDEHPRLVDVVGTVALRTTDRTEVAEQSHERGLEAHVADQVRELGAAVVLLTTDARLLGIHPMRLVWALEETGAVLVTDTGLTTMPSGRIEIQRIGGLMTYVARRRPARTIGTALSGAVQWTAALFGLIMLSPVLFTLAVYIRVDSTGGAFYVQERVGCNGRRFRMLKFRTMVKDADKVVHEVAPDEGAPDRGPLFKVQADPRVTRAGRFLRRSSLDELPQLVNVVLGHMRLIGPRPALPGEVAEYRGYESRRLMCMPGMTGLWQVNGRSDLDWQRSVELDQKYVDGRSLSMDAGIISKTPRAVFSSRGAY